MCKRILIIAAVCLLYGYASAADDPSVTQTGMAVFEYYGTMSIGVYAEVENTGDHPVAFDNGQAEVFDENGNSIAASDRVYCFPIVLAPGETGYAYSILRPENTVTMAAKEYAISVTGTAVSKDAGLFETTGTYVTVESGSWSYRYMAAEILNETEDTAYDIYCVFALKDETGHLLYVDMLNAYMLGIPGNSSVYVRMIVPDSLLLYLETNDFTPAAVDAIAFRNPYLN